MVMATNSRVERLMQRKISLDHTPEAHFFYCQPPKSCEVRLSECGFLRFGGTRHIPTGGMKFAINCTEFSEATVVEASVLSFWFWDFGVAAGKDLRLQA
jgi:hypothetical protein